MNVKISYKYNKEEIQNFYFSTENEEVYQPKKLKDIITNVKQSLRTRIDDFQAKGSD